MNREDKILKLCKDSGVEIGDGDLEYGEICYLPLNGTFMDYIDIEEVDANETDENIAELIIKILRTKHEKHTQYNH